VSDLALRSRDLSDLYLKSRDLRSKRKHSISALICAFAAPIETYAPSAWHAFLVPIFLFFARIGTPFLCICTRTCDAACYKPPADAQTHQVASSSHSQCHAQTHAHARAYAHSLTRTLGHTQANRRGELPDKISTRLEADAVSFAAVLRGGSGLGLGFRPRI
jgi:hypothetical protein